MKYLLLTSILVLSSCASRPKTHTEVPSLKYAQKYVSDAKDYNSRARKTNNEIDEEIRKLLEGAE